jgi:hypothetical protein
MPKPTAGCSASGRRRSINIIVSEKFVISIFRIMTILGLLGS